MREKARHLIPVLLLTIFYLYSAYNTGLFFAPLQTYTLTYVLILSLIVIIVVRSLSLRMSTWLIIGSGYIFYLFVTTLWAAAPELAVAGALVLTSALLIALYAASTERNTRLYLLAFLATLGAGIYLFGLGTVFHWWNYNAAIAGGMLNSIFQYHNTFGAFELSTYAIGVGLMEYATRWWSRALFTVCSSLSLLGVISSYSRWVWILIPIVLLLHIVLQGIRNRALRAATQSAYALIIPLAASPFAISAMANANSSMFFITLLIVVAGSVAVGLLDQVFPKLTKRKAMRNGLLVVAGLGIVLGGAYLVHHEAHKLTSILTRANSIHFKDFSVQQRILFYKAGFRMWIDNPVFGTGSGSWTAKFQAYEQYPYWTTKAHSIFMNNLINGGLIGLALWVGTIGAAVVSAFKAIRTKSDLSALQATALTGSAALFLHALFDFDFSYPLVEITFFVLLALATRSTVKDSVTPSNVDAKPWASLRAKYSISSSILFVGTGALGFVLALMVSISQYSYNRALAMPDSTQKATLLNRAISWAPFDPMPHLALAQYSINLVPQSNDPNAAQQAWQQAQTTASTGHWDPGVQQQAASIAYKFGHLDDAYRYAKQCYIDGPFHIQYPSTFMGIGLWTSVIQYKQDPQLARQHLHEVVTVLHTAKANIKDEEHMPYGLHQEWPYKINAPMQTYAATADFVLGNYKASLDDLKNLPSDGLDASTQGLADLVTTMVNQRLKSGHVDKTLYNKLLSDPTLKAEYQYLNNIQPIH